MNLGEANPYLRFKLTNPGTAWELFVECSMLRKHLAWSLANK